MKLSYMDRAKDDVEFVLAWYGRQRRGLGFEFLDDNRQDPEKKP